MVRPLVSDDEYIVTKKSVSKHTYLSQEVLEVGCTTMDDLSFFRGVFNSYYVIKRHKTNT